MVINPATCMWLLPYTNSVPGSAVMAAAES
jgi:hypothetical protein